MARLGRNRPHQRLTLLRPDFLLLGVGDATAAGATVTEQTSLLAGSATGAASAAAVTVNLTTAPVSGAATGAASAAAVTVTEQESLSTAGAATGAATRAGVTVTEQGSLVAGAATGASTAAAATVSLATSLIVGSAVVSVTAAGATVTEQTSLIAGAATGAATGAAATVTEQTSLVATAATGAASAAAATVSLSTSLIAGSATTAAVGAGVTVTQTAAMVPGAATGAATCAGVTVTEQDSLIAGSAVVGVVAPGATITETTSLVATTTYPDASNTGPRFSFTSTSGPMAVTTPGAVIERVDFNDTIGIEANNVTIRDCRFTSFLYYGAVVNDGVTGTVIEYCEFSGSGDLAIAGSDTTVRYCNLHGMGDGIRIGNNNLIEHSYIHDFRVVEGDHNDGIQGLGGDNVTIRHNTIINQNSQTSAILIGNQFGPATNVLITDNYLKGGGYTIYSDAGVTVTNNLIGMGAFGWNNWPPAAFRRGRTTSTRPRGATSPMTTTWALSRRLRRAGPQARRWPRVRRSHSPEASLRVRRARAPTARRQA